MLLFLYRDNVTIEVSLSRLRWSQKEVRRCNFHVAMDLVLAEDSISRHGLVKTKGFYVATGHFYVSTEFG